MKWRHIPSAANKDLKNLDMNSNQGLDIICEGILYLEKTFLINRSANPLASMDQ